MRNASVIVQIALFVIGVAVIWLYVYPAFTSISDDQDRISEYDEAITEASEVNQLLDALLQEIESVPSDDQEALSTYLPAEIDRISVQRDLLAYTQQVPVNLQSLLHDRDLEVVEETNRSASTFSVGIRGSYDDIKDFLLAVEQNAYPLHIETLTMETVDMVDIQANITFMTYAFNNVNPN